MFRASLLLAALSVPALAHAAPILVDQTNDSTTGNCSTPGSCTLRAAFAKALAAGGGEITLNVDENMAAGVIDLTPASGHTANISVKAPGGVRYITGNDLTPFLHVAESNHGARRVYERIGFTTRRMTQFAALRTPDAA